MTNNQSQPRLRLIIVALLSALLSALATLAMVSRSLPDACLEAPRSPEVSVGRAPRVRDHQYPEKLVRRWNHGGQQ